MFNSCAVAAGGRCVTFNNTIDISCTRLYQSGDMVNVNLDDFITFTKQNVLDTTDSCELLECTRQNLSYLVKSDKLKPIRDEVRGSLYLKADIMCVAE